MTIAINSIQLIKFAGNDYFLKYFSRIAASRPEHHFIIIIATETDKTPDACSNITFVISSPLANNTILWKAWLNYTLPKIARKHKAEILINTTGVCSLRTRIPQALVLSDLSYLAFPQFFLKKEVSFLKKYMPAFLARANKIVTVSAGLTNEISSQYAIDEKKINQFQLKAGEPYKPISFEEKESVKETFAEGREYFLFHGELNERSNLLNLLKAFSFFKKRQKSNMQLFIALHSISVNDPFIENLKTYKYRGDVKLLTGLSDQDLIKIYAAAYAFIDPSRYDSMPLFALRAIQSGIPVLTGITCNLKEIMNDAALYADPENFEDIAQKMMLLFKDETKRRELITRGNAIIQNMGDDQSNALMFDSIFKSIDI
ncbi:MAG: glycosyltransferase [Ferruginibacter sp.]